MMLGTIGRAILAFITENIVWFSAIFVVWAAIVLWANSQLTKARTLTVGMATKYIKNHEEESDAQIWKGFQPEWEAAITELDLKWIPGKHNLWVTRSSIEDVTNILKMGPKWFESLRHGVVLQHRGALPGEEYKLKSRVHQERDEKRLKNRNKKK